MKQIKLTASSGQRIIRLAVEILSRGGLIIYPTETVYGLGADATSQAAVDRLLRFKGQRGRKPILIAVSDERMAGKYVKINAAARNIYRQFLPGPVAVVSLVKGGLARGIESPEATAGVRIPDYPLIREIIRHFGKPITTTSANISGARHPWSVEDIFQTTPAPRLGMIDLVIDAGSLPKRPPSTIIDTSKEETEIVRRGEIDISDFRIKNFQSGSAGETVRIGQQTAQEILKKSGATPVVFALQGELGAGKTVFVSGIARALGIASPIRSPSYTLIREYLIPSSLGLHPSAFFYHVDAWRLHSADEFADLGLQRMLRPQNVIAIEWPARLVPIIPSLRRSATVILVDIEVISENKRRISVTI